MSSEPFLSREAGAKGLRRGQLHSPRVRQLFPGVHVVEPSELTLPILVAGARRLLPVDALVTGVTALRMAVSAAFHGRGARAARRAAGMVRTRVDSAQELQALR